MQRTYSIGKRLIALVLSLVLILSVMPSVGVLGKASAASVDTGILETLADAGTLDSWKDAFNPMDLSTEHAGGVWTDKSVIKAEDVSSVFGNIAGLEAGANNFLVALSALAANSVVLGQGTTPTDTILVLDISGSMSSANLRAMVTAANDSIHTLLVGNEKNRVGVVLYSTSASVLLPLGRYTPVTETQGTVSKDDDVIEYIEYSNSRIRAARVASGGFGQGGNNQANYTYITDSNGEAVTTSISTGGGTYIQGGLWKAWEQFDAATVTDKRAPVLVLMSDGAPTFISNDFNRVPNGYEGGDGNSSGDGEGFLTQLTAAYVKAQIAAKYSTGTYNAKAYMYTLGLGLSAGNATSVAQAVLDTGKTRPGMTNYWDTYLGLAAKQTKTMDVEVYRSGWGGSTTTDVTVTYDAILNNAAQKNYVDKYFSASSAGDLSAAFKGIVNEISLKSSYYVTRLDGQNANTGGYVTFVDEIGIGMEVKEIEGILIGDTLYTGLKLAQALKNGSFGTQEVSTELGDNMVWALVQRLGITNVTDEHGTVTMTAGDIARDLLNKAFAAGQLKYESDTNWSNLICWFGDANGNYIGFWDKDDPNAQLPEGAAFANMCYGMLGATTENAAAHASDMMYVAVQVSKPVTKVGGRLTIQEKSPQTVTFRIPASLLPTVTYQISVEEENREQIDTQTAAAITYNAADPIRLIYEVGVHSALTPENIHQFVREGYQAKDSDGNYYLYTNAWNWTPADGSAADLNNPPTATSEELKDTGKNAITYAYFEPGEDNEHYYFTDDTLIYIKNAAGDYVLYEGDEKPSGTCYYKHLVYTATADSQDPAKEAAAAVTVHYELLSDAALKEAVATDGAKTWQIPKGTMHRNMHSHNRDKTANTTGSFFAIRHQLVDMAVNGDHSHHYELVYMGNNGRVTYAPAQGVALTKEMAAGETAEGKSFSFTVTVAGDTDGKVTVTRNGVSAAETLVDNKLQLTLAAGETVLITGMDIGATYTIQENKQDGFKLSGIAAGAGAVVNNAAGTVSNEVESNQIHTVTYTNAIQYYGSLLISKEVDYLKNSQPAGANAAKFTVKVTFPGLGGEKVYVDGAAVELESDGTYTFPIVDGKSVLITGIPEGTAYGVEELLEEGTHIPAGYEAEDGYTAVAYSFNGTIVKDTAQMAALKNQYVPGDVIFNDVEPKITIQINKTLAGTQLNNWAFDFELLYFDGSAWTPVMTGLTATKDDPSITFNLEDIQLSSVGEHYFRVAEVIPAAQMMGMTYDRTFNDFKVTVMDDLSGKLKIQKEESVQHAVVGEPVDSNNDGVKELWTVTTGFTNTFAADSTKLTIQANKTLFNKTTGVEVPMALKDGQFRFTLYKADQNFGNLEQIDESANGVTGQIIFTPITYEFNENGTEKTYYYVVKETSQSGSGYTVDSAVYKITVTVKQQTAASGSALQITNVTVQKNEDAAADVTQSVLDGGNVLNGSTVSFKNIYQATPAQVQINGTKNLFDLTPGAGNAAIAVPNGLFSFKLTALNGAPMEAGNGNGYKIVTNNGSTFTFPTISYTQAGTYHYTVSEEAVTAAGYSKDTAVHNITVFVTDHGTGRLTAVAAYNGEEVNSSTVQVVFNNTYKAEPVTDIVLKGSKELKVDTTKFTRVLRAGEFRFTLTKPDGTTQTVANDAAGKFSFAPLTFTELGTYTYTVTEEGAGTVKNGMTYDKASYKVTVTVTDGDKDGKLEAAVKYEKVTDQGGVDAQEAVFVNEYKAAPVSVQLTAHKYLVGNRDLEANEFSFTMTKPGGVTETVKNGKDGIVTFESVTYSAAGTYVYTIVEDKVDQAGNLLTPDQDGNYVYNGVTYSRVEYTVTVKITDNGSGALVAHVTTVDNNGNELPVQFFNRYEAQSVTANLTGENDKLGGKTLEDKTSGDDKKDLSDFEFKFVLTDEDGNEIETVSDNDVNGFKFTGIKFTEPGEKIYYIYEQNTGAAGISYDAARFKVTVQITDNEKGQLEADLRYERITAGADGAENSQVVQEISFTNTYEADPAGMWISGTKQLHNETPNIANKIMATPAGMFSFKLTALNGAPMGAGNTAGYEIKFNDADGKFAFTPIHYTQEGTYKYTLAEEDTSVAGVTKDMTIHHITVIVKDNGAGQLVADITCDGEQVSGNAVQVQFRNTYLAKPVTGIVLSGNKILDVPDYLHHSLQAGDFSFTLTKPDGKTETVTNDGEGKFSFTALDFDAVGTYTYKITEVGGGTSKDGIAYDEKTITVVIVVEDGGNGKLVAKVGDTRITNYNVGTFKNTYRAQSVTVNLEGEKANTEGKTLEDQSSLVDKTLNDFEFKFVLTDANGNVIETVADNGAGFDFADITYSAPAQKVYFIYELDEDVPGVIYDTAKYKVIVKVTDNEKGCLEAEVSYEKITTDPNGRQETEKADKITFANTYTAKETAVSFTGLKTFNGGRKLKAGEFSFILKDANGKEMETVSNDGDGKFTFKSITYTEEGKHVYILEEVKGQDDKVTYDSTKYTLTVTVADVNGALKATTQITVDNKEAESYGFTNLFTPENAVAKITVEKILVNNTDQTVGLNGFQFDLSCVETGKLISAISGTDGLAELELSFGAADVGKTYTYLLTEHKGNVEGMTYSDAVYQIKVAVTQDAQTGALVLNVTRDDAAAAGNAKFTNTLNKVTPPEDEIPKTGDETFVGGWILMMSVSAISLLAVLVMGKRKHTEQ